MSQLVPRASRPDQWTHRGPREAWGSIFSFRPGVTLVHQRSTLKTAARSLSIIAVISCWSPTLSPMVQCLLLFLGLLWSLYNPDRRWTHTSWCNSAVTWLIPWIRFFWQMSDSLTCLPWPPGSPFIPCTPLKPWEKKYINTAQTFDIKTDQSDTQLWFFWFKTRTSDQFLSRGGDVSWRGGLDWYTLAAWPSSVKPARDRSFNNPPLKWDSTFGPAKPANPGSPGSQSHSVGPSVPRSPSASSSGSVPGKTSTWDDVRKMIRKVHRPIRETQP